jgi:flagellar M-ring protein FliF
MSEILSIFNKLSFQQKILIGGGIIVTLILLGVSFVFLNEPSYSTLFTGLHEEDASKVIEQLTSSKVPYKIEDAGKTIKVPQEKVYETRLNLAGKGIPGSGTVGYEIFDKSTMGMSEFMQKLNYKRALEGELSKTIAQQEGVDAVRVHIVIPQKSIFKDEDKQPTASVVLKLRSSFVLSKTNIAAILNLVSSSVEGLTPNRVTLIDTKGRLLSKESDDNSLALSSTKQYEIKENVESYLSQKAQSILDNVVGFGNAMIQVNADINFDQVEKTMTTFDPETQVAVSEQVSKADNAGKNSGDSTSQTNQNTTTNYEISKTIEKVVGGSGNIKRLSVAVIVNDGSKEVKEGDKVNIVAVPRTSEQLRKLEEVVKNAVGYDLTRSDQFSIQSMPFELKQVEEVSAGSGGFFDNYNQWSGIILIVVAIGASAFILKSLMFKLKNEKIVIGTYGGQMPAFDGYSASASGGSFDRALTASSGQTAALMNPKRKELLPLGDIEDEISEEAIIKKNQHEKIQNYVTKNPADAAKLINAWLHEDEL